LKVCVPLASEPVRMERTLVAVPKSSGGIGYTLGPEILPPEHWDE